MATLKILRLFYVAILKNAIAYLFVYTSVASGAEPPVIVMWYSMTTYSYNIFYQKPTIVVSKSLTATRLGKDISIVSVPLRKNANLFVMKWKLAWSVAR